MACREQDGGNFIVSAYREGRQIFYHMLWKRGKDNSVMLEDQYQQCVVEDEKLVMHFRKHLDRMSNTHTYIHESKGNLLTATATMFKSACQQSRWRRGNITLEMCFFIIYRAGPILQHCSHIYWISQIRNSNKWDCKNLMCCVACQ